MRDADYIYAVACIRAKEKTLLNDADVQTMVGMKRSLDPDMEKVLSEEEEKQMKLLKTLGVDEKIIDTLFIQEVYHNLKAAIKEVCTGLDDSQAFYEHDKYGKKVLMDIIREKDFEKLPQDMAVVAEKALDLMLTTQDGQRLDVMIDRACLDAIEKEAATTKDKFLADYAETKVVISDIKIAVRAADTKRPLSMIQDALAPNRKFDVKQLAVAAATNREAVYEFLSRAGYNQAVEALKDSFSAFEKWCDDYVMSTLMNQKTNIQSSGPIVAFFLAKQNEIRTARIIMTAKANGFSDDVISERVRKMYG